MYVTLIIDGRENKGGISDKVKILSATWIYQFEGAILYVSATSNNGQFGIKILIGSNWIITLNYSPLVSR